MKTVGVRGTKVSTSPSATVKGATWLQISSRVSIAERFTPLQQARRKHGQMSGQMGQFGVQLAAEAFDKFPDRISYVGHQGITRGQHDPVVNYTP